MNKVIGTTLSELLSDEVKPTAAQKQEIKQRIEQFFQEGLADLKKEKFMQAAVKIGAVVLLAPDHVKALNNLAVAYYNLEEKEECISILHRLLELEPDNTIARENLQALLDD